jgi:metallo-beta-lactamase class B
MRRVLLGLAAILALVLFGKWREATKRGGQQPAEPFRIAGNLYYVGANDVTSFLITGPEGHVLIDGGYPGTPPLIMASIARLGFKVRDVKVLLNSHSHYDHAGGLAELQQASGAALWVSEGDADIVASGGLSTPNLGPLRILMYLGITRYPAPRVDHRFRNGDTIRLGPIQLTAHVTPGHTPGCTSWSFPVRDGDRELLVVHACSLKLPPFVSLVDPEKPAGIRADFERTFRTLRSLPADIFITAHAREFGRYRKFQERATATNPVDPFIDRKGYLDFISRGEADFRNELAREQGRR